MADHNHRNTHPKPSGKVPDTHSIGSISDDLGVFTVTNIATENTDAVPPAHPVPRTPTLPRQRRRARARARRWWRTISPRTTKLNDRTKERLTRTRRGGEDQVVTRKVRRRCKRPSPGKSRLRRLRRSRGQNVRLTVERCNEAVDALALQDRGKFGVADRHLADRAVEIDVGDQPAIAVAAHHVVDLDRLAIRFDDLAAHHDTGPIELLASYLQLLSGIAVKAVGVDRRDVTPEALRHLLPLGLGQSGPGRADRQPGHRRNVESPANDWL